MSTPRLFLFNSAYRTKYFRNVLTTLALPTGAVNEYRFTCGDAHSYVDDLAAGSKVGDPVTIVFADRWHPGGYLYVPLRHGRLLKNDLDGIRRHFSVELGEYASLPPDPVTAGEALRAALARHRAPNLQGNDPMNTRDGYYAFVASSPDELEPFLKTDLEHRERWDKIVALISERKAFAERLDAVPVFLRVTLEDQKGERRVRPRAAAAVATVDLVRASPYQFNVTFRFPAYEQYAAREAALCLSPTENLRLLGPDEVPLDSTGNRVVVPLTFRRYTDEDEASIRLSSRVAPTDGLTKPLVVADLPLVLRATLGNSAKWQLLGAILGFAVGSLLVGLDSKSVVCAWNNRSVSPELMTGSLTKLVGAFVQASAAYAAIRVLGKKFL